MCLVHGDVWGTLALARRMESMNMHGGLWNCAVVQAIDGRRAKNQDMMCLLCCLFLFTTYFMFILSSAHTQKLRTPLQMQSPTHRCNCCKNYLHRSIKSHVLDISTPLKELVLDKRSDWTSRHWREWFKNGDSQLHASFSYISWE